jgi:hypothetical protein
MKLLVRRVKNEEHIAFEAGMKDRTSLAKHQI